MSKHHRIIVVGAGFAGLACAARLRARGISDFAVLEKGSGVGGFWRGNYDRIRLHTPFHELPDDGGIRRDYGQFLPRDTLIEYFERYAAHHQLSQHLSFDTEVVKVARNDAAWHVETSEGTLTSDYLVLATAYNRVPLVPEFKGAEHFNGTLVHSRDYKNADPYAGQNALIVGSGNSAAEIALDLCEGGAASVTMLVRGARHVLSMRGLGIAARVARALRIELTPKHIAASHPYSRTHPEFRAKLAEKDKFFLTFSIDMSAYGIEKPEPGPATQIALHGRVPWMDQGTVKAIRDGRITVIDAKKTPLMEITANGAVIGDQAMPFELIVLATGMQPGLENLFEDPDPFLYWNEDMSRRMPNTDGRSRSVVEPTLFFPGLDLSANGGLSLGLWGFECADAIADEQAVT